MMKKTSVKFYFNSLFFAIKLIGRKFLQLNKVCNSIFFQFIRSLKKRQFQDQGLYWQRIYDIYFHIQKQFYIIQNEKNKKKIEIETLNFNFTTKILSKKFSNQIHIYSRYEVWPKDGEHNAKIFSVEIFCMIIKYPMVSSPSSFSWKEEKSHSKKKETLRDFVTCIYAA